jgi:hypothetical protein
MQIEQQRQQRRHQGQGQAGGEPVGGNLGQGGEFQRQGRERNHIQAAILEIALEQPVQRQQRCQHRRHPQHPACHAGEQAQIRTHA